MVHFALICFPWVFYFFLSKVFSAHERTTMKFVLVHVVRWQTNVTTATMSIVPHLWVMASRK